MTLGNRGRYNFGSEKYYPEAANYSSLPSVSGYAGHVYLVLASEWVGVWYHRAGLYHSDGTTWTRMANLTVVSDEIFTLVDNTTNTKKAMFECSTIAAATTRTFTFPDQSGTLAVLTDLTAGALDWHTTGFGRFDGGVGVGVDPTAAYAFYIQSARDPYVAMRITNTTFNMDVMSVYETSGSVWSMGIDDSIGKFVIARYGTFASNVNLTIDSSNDFDFQAGNILTTGSGRFDDGLGIGTAPIARLLRIYKTTATLGVGLDIDNLGAGDAVVKFALDGVPKFVLGVDNDDGDKFKISRGGVLGTTDALAIDSSGNFVIGGDITGGAYNGATITVIAGGLTIDDVTNSNSVLIDGDYGIIDNTDGFYIYGGTTPRQLTVTGGDWTLDQDVSSGANVNFGTGDFAGGVTVNSAKTSGTHLTLQGFDGGPATRRGGSIAWGEDAGAILGYTFVNADSEFVWDSTAQASGGDDGVAKVSFSTGKGTFGGLQVGSTTPQSTFPELVTAENYYSGANQQNWAGGFSLCFSGSSNDPILYGVFGEALYDGVDPTGTGNIYGLGFFTGINSGVVTGGIHNFSNISVTHIDAGAQPTGGIINLTGLKIADSPAGYTGGGATVNSVGIEIGDISGDTAYAIKTGLGLHKFGDTVDIISTTDPQFRLTHTDGVDECDFYVDADGHLNIDATGLQIDLFGTDTVADGAAGGSLYLRRNAAAELDTYLRFWIADDTQPYIESSTSLINFNTTSLTTTANFIGPIQVSVDTGVQLTAAAGILTMAGLGPGQDEDLTWDFNTTLNRVGVGTTQGVTGIDFAMGATFGDGGTTNYSQFEADGTLEFNGAATVFNDLQFQISDAKVTPASLLPSWEAFTTNTSEYAFSVNDEVDTSANEIPHSWKQGTIGNAHMHITTKAINNAEITYAKFTVTFAYADTDEVWVEAPLTAEKAIANPTAALTNLYLDLGDITLTNYLIEAQMRCRVKRIAATTGTEYAGDIFITQVGIHFEEDTIGSRAETSK